MQYQRTPSTGCHQRFEFHLKLKTSGLNLRPGGLWRNLPSVAGKPWMSVIVRSGDGDAASFVQAAIFGDAAVALGRIERNEKLYAEGSIRINEWTTAAGEKRTGLSMAAWRAERPGVGRNPKTKLNPLVVTTSRESIV
jgi:hypothetical protein